MSKLNSVLFNLVHKNNLIYNTCWEDPRIDREALELNSASTVAMITSAGCNALDYVLAGAGKIHTVDLNPKQNALLELKLAAARGLSYDEFFEWFGNGKFYKAERVYQQELRKFLSPSAQAIWDGQIKYFSGSGWRPSFYFHGTSGFFARLVNFYLDNIVCARELMNLFLGATNLSVQRTIYYQQLKPVFWTKLIQWLVSRDVTLALLGVPLAQRKQVEQYSHNGIRGFIESCLDQVFGNIPFQDNYFWRVYLTGRYSKSCCPQYLTKEGYTTLREGGWEKITIHTKSMSEFLNGTKDEISHFVLLDHMDWLNTHLKPELEIEWQAIFNRAREGARIIWRSGGREVDFVDGIKVMLRGRPTLVGKCLQYNHEKAKMLHERDRVHTYGSFYIADVCTA